MDLIFPQSCVIEYHLYPDSTFDFRVETSHGCTYYIVSCVRTLNRDHLFTSHEQRLSRNDFMSQLIWTIFEKVWKVKGSLAKSMNLVKDFLLWNRIFFLVFLAYNLEMRDCIGVQMSLITFIFCIFREEKSDFILSALGIWVFLHKIHYYNKWVARICVRKLLRYSLFDIVLLF